MFAAAFYRGTRPGVPGIYNRLVRAFEGGPFSHCELAFSDGASASASFMDGGVRFCGMDYAHPAIDFANGAWELVPLPAHLEPAARQWFREHDGQAYDLRGNLRFVWPWGNRDSRRKSFCSEAVLASLGMPEAFRFGVNAAAAACQRLGADIPPPATLNKDNP